MPNWCYNKVTVTSKKEGARDKFEQRVNDPKGEYYYGMTTPDAPEGNRVFSLEKIIPYPNGVWDYDWCNRNWGTKWDTTGPAGEFHTYTDSPLIMRDGNVLVYNFDTPWGPPTGIVKYLYKNLEDITGDPDARMTWYYNEQGMGESGHLTLNGDNLYNTEEA